MKESDSMKITNYLSGLANKPNDLKLLLACLAFAITSIIINRWLYMEVPSMGLALKVPLIILVAAGTVSGLYVFGVLSYRLNRSLHIAFGFIELVVLMAATKFGMAHLIAAGFEPVSGPPIFGGILATVILGWIFGVLLAFIDRNE